MIANAQTTWRSRWGDYVEIWRVNLRGLKDCLLSRSIGVNRLGFEYSALRQHVPMAKTNWHSH